MPTNIDSGHLTVLDEGLQVLTHRCMVCAGRPRLRHRSKVLSKGSDRDSHLQADELVTTVLAVPQALVQLNSIIQLR
jgi:hypothetical protein